MNSNNNNKKNLSNALFEENGEAFVLFVAVVVGFFLFSTHGSLC